MMEMQPQQPGPGLQNTEASDTSSVLSSPTLSPHTSAITFEDTIAVQPLVHNAGVAASAKHTTNAPGPEKNKRPRKKKDPATDGIPKADEKPKEKKPRKARTVNPNAPGSASRKKQKLDDATPSRQTTLTGLVGAFQAPQPPARPAQQSTLTTAPTTFPAAAPSPALQAQSAPKAADKRYMYDPIRGMNIESRPHQSSTPPPQASPHMYRASASPAISSLVDPPRPAPTSATTSPRPLKVEYDPAASTTDGHKRFSLILNQTSPSSSAPGQTRPASMRPEVQLPPAEPLAVWKPTTSSAISTLDGAMDIDLPRTNVIRDHPSFEAASMNTPALLKENAPPSKPVSAAPTPKAKNPTPPVVPSLPGSGLLSSSDLFSGAKGSEDKGGPRHGVDIEIRIALNPKGGNTINIAQEILKKYGRDAINPRAAAHRERLLQVAAAANRLEQGSGDDMSVDLSELDNDSNVEMGGTGEDRGGEGPEGADGEKPKRKRRRKLEEYDKEDDFIDDAELAWEEQAAVAKDGFFVYSGPLVHEGEKTSVESSTPSARGRGRGGRGRGRGATTAAVATGTTHTVLAAKTSDPPSAAASVTGRGRGRGGRGTGAPRKPRATKADKEKIELEKTQRAHTVGGLDGKLVASTPTTTASVTAAPTTGASTMSVL